MNPFSQKPGYSYINVKNGEIEFILWAPTQHKIDLKITAPEMATYPMQLDEWGYWKTTVPNVKEGARYVYVLEDGSERPDPASISQPEGVHLASEVVSRSFNWSDQSWKGVAMEDLIIYELHTGTFTEQGTFDGILSKLDYLVELGINAIEIMPIAQFSGNWNWGYDGVYPFAIQHSYGTAHDLKNLVNAAHNKGIAVILDVVYNHMGPEGCYLKDFSLHYFTNKYNTPWGDALNFDGPYSNGVRNYFIQNALMWLDEFHIDGLRMDAIHAIYDHSAYHIMQELKDAVKELEEKSGKKKFLVAELDLNDARYINPVQKGGYGLDGQWIDEFHHALHSVLTGETDGYYEDFGSLYHLEQAYRNTYVYNGMYSRHRKKIFGSQPDNPYHQFVVFSQNHDHIGNRALGDRLTTTLSFEALKLAAAAVLLSPYVPMLFMGEEYGEKNPFLYFVNHQDQELGKLVSEGRRKEFAYFNFKEEFPDPLSEEVFKQSKLSWEYAADEEQTTMLSFYKHLIEFRKMHPAMQAKNRSNTNVYPVGMGNILALERFNDSDRLLIVMNFGKEKEAFLNNTISRYKKLFDSSDIEWKGPQVGAFSELPINQSIEIHPMSVSIFHSIS